MLPRTIAPGKPGAENAPPSDAIILFDGGDLSQWCSERGEDPQWEVRDGELIVKPGSGNLLTRKSFGDIQLHLEWAAPEKIEGEGQIRGNSGVFLQGRYEIQILDSFENPTYPDGQAGAIYKQSPPLVNAARRPGEWQSFDLVYRAPRFDEAGSVVRNAVVTLLYNCVLVQEQVEILGVTANEGEPRYVAHADREPLMLQDHRSPVRFRNIWVRELA